MKSRKLISLFSVVLFQTACVTASRAGDGDPLVVIPTTAPSQSQLNLNTTYVPQHPYVTITNGQLHANNNQVILNMQTKMAKSSYLGISAVAADATLRAQLKLPNGVGLAVANVDDQGPSKSVVQEHDVLYKLGDQILVNPEQFVVLVRMHKPGETVELTVFERLSR